ncbi:MAG TPA: hypothetical protein VF469_18855 [Kofleriaceae bacterium]
MSRYFRRFYNADPMVEIDEVTARQGGSYVEEIAQPIRAFRCFAANRPTALIYSGWDDPSQPLADAKARGEGLPVTIYSPVERSSDGHQRWRTWYADAAGQVEKILEPEMDSDGRYLKESYRGPAGELRSYQEYVYDRDDELLEVVTHAPDGSILNRQHS